MHARGDADLADEFLGIRRIVQLTARNDQGHDDPWLLEGTEQREVLGAAHLNGDRAKGIDHRRPQRHQRQRGWQLGAEDLVPALDVSHRFSLEVSTFTCAASAYGKDCEDKRTTPPARCRGGDVAAIRSVGSRRAVLMCEFLPDRRLIVMHRLHHGDTTERERVTPGRESGPLHTRCAERALPTRRDCHGVSAASYEVHSEGTTGDAACS